MVKKETSKSSRTSGAQKNVQHRKKEKLDTNNPDLFPKVDVPATEKSSANQPDLSQQEQQKKSTGISIPNAPTVLYMPVDTLRAQVFLAHGLMFPSLYDTVSGAASFDDIQSQAPANLSLLTFKPQLRKNQVLLHVLVMPDEIADSIKSGETIRLQFPLPISRLVRIGIPTDSGDVGKYVAGWVKPDVPAPRELFETAGSTERTTDTASDGPENVKALISLSGIKESIAAFDKCMGAFAFLRNSRRYFSGITGMYSDYPPVLFALANRLFDKHPQLPNIPQIPPVLGAILDLGEPSANTIKALVALVNSTSPYIEKNTARDTAKILFEDAGSPEALAHAFKSLFDGDYKAAAKILQKDGIPQEAPVLAALFKFSSRQSNDHRNVKQRLHEDWPCGEMTDQILAALGKYYGYTALDARETRLYSVDPQIQPLVDPQPPIKFTLSTRYERRLIEAIYQRAFYKRTLDVNHSALYEHAPETVTTPRQRARSVWVKDMSFEVSDLIVGRYEVTWLGRLLQRLRALPGDSIDERSEVGRYLFRDCYDLADESDTVRRKGAVSRRYKISKSRLFDILADEKIPLNTKVLETCVEEDEKKLLR